MDKKTKWAAALLAVAAVAAASFYLFGMGGEEKPALEQKVLGIKVTSMIPLSEFQKKTTVALIDQPGTKEETTCNFEISQTSAPDQDGYPVKIERKPAEVRIEEGAAYVRGESDEELLTACHAFLCLRDGIECASNMMDIKNVTLKDRAMIVVLDNRTKGKAHQGFIEVLGALGFLQAQLSDQDKDGIVTQNESDASKINIYPYIMDGDNCVLQPFEDALQVTNVTNDTTKCDFYSGVHIVRSGRNSISIEGRKVIISGDDEHIYKASVIVRDILSPEYVRFLHRLY